MPNGINVAEIARGALIEQAEGEIQKVLENIADQNTDPMKARKVTITLTFKPTDQKRESVAIGIQTKSSIVPYNSVTTQIYLGKDNSGKVMAEEFVKGTMVGQTMINADTGEILREDKKVINMK